MLLIFSIYWGFRDFSRRCNDGGVFLLFLDVYEGPEISPRVEMTEGVSMRFL